MMTHPIPSDEAIEDRFHDEVEDDARHERRRHPQMSDVPVADVGGGGDDDDNDPPDYVLVCESCGAREPAPFDLSPGDTDDCASCGETMTVESA